jgi:hypothetical protein
MTDNDYLYIDLKKTGMRLEGLIRQKGYSVRDIQNILHLSCPQPIYRWMRGQILPSVDHLYVLSRVLQVHMEELLVAAHRMPETAAGAERSRWRRMSEYQRRFSTESGMMWWSLYVSFHDRFGEYQEQGPAGR